MGNDFPAAKHRKSRAVSIAGRAGAISAFGTSRGGVRNASDPSAAISAQITERPVPHQCAIDGGNGLPCQQKR